jgi:cellulose synthase/poly-beta-1,6-N-acetylglucosamine synthase-like glycosyltransferase
MGLISSSFFLGVIMAIIAMLPPAFHNFKMGAIPLDDISVEEISIFPAITVFIPARDEELLLEKKLLNVISMDYPPSKLRILVIDSGSIDSTGEIARDILSSHSGEISWSIERLETPGKSIAVNRAIGIIDTEFFVMTDVDSKCPTDSLKIAVSRLVNEPNLGAICGRKISSTMSPLHSYRWRFNRVRIGESILDSTPIFEGSFCAFRTSSVSIGIDDSINADDTQLALLSRRNNFRSVMDSRLEFIEPKSNFFREYKRSVRRAQGITRCLFRNRDLSRVDGHFGRFFSNNFYFYLIFPWLMVSSILLVSPVIYDQLFSNQDAHSIAIWVILLILFYVSVRPVRDFIIGLSVLIISQLLILVRTDLSVWRPIR